MDHIRVHPPCFPEIYFNVFLPPTSTSCVLSCVSIYDKLVSVLCVIPCVIFLSFQIHSLMAQSPELWETHVVIIQVYLFSVWRSIGRPYSNICLKLLLRGPPTAFQPKYSGNHSVSFVARNRICRNVNMKACFNKRVYVCCVLSCVWQELHTIDWFSGH